MRDEKINLESLLYSYYIKYDVLSSLCSQLQTDKLDIYIDLYDMLKPIYVRPIYSEKQFVIVSSVINLAAHMRAYFWSRHRILTRIYLVYGEDSTMNHKQFCPSFGDDSFKNMLDYPKNNSVINSQLDMVKVITGYISGVYFIKRSTNFSMFVYDNIIRNPNLQAIILTKSKYAYQIPALLNNTIIFRPKKLPEGDVSFSIYTAVAAQYGMSAATIKDSNIGYSLFKMNPALLSLMYTINGLSSYGLKTLCNRTVAIRMIKAAIDDSKILNDYNGDPDFIYNSLNGIQKYIDQLGFKYRFNAVDLVFQHRLYNSSIEARDISWCIDLEDRNALQNISNKYFVDNPLDLGGLGV